MRTVLACAALAASVLVGCGSAAPAASAAPGAIGAPAVVASGATGPTPVPGAVTAPPLAAGQLELTAFNIDFEPKALVAPSGPLELRFHNRDAGVPHNVAINDEHGGSVFEPEIFVGPASVDYSIPDLAPGSYTYLCTVHPNMTGTLTVLP